MLVACGLLEILDLHMFFFFFSHATALTLFLACIADLEKSHHQRVSELQRLRSMYVVLLLLVELFYFYFSEFYGT